MDLLWQKMTVKPYRLVLLTSALHVQIGAHGIIELLWQNLLFQFYEFGGCDEGADEYAESSEMWHFVVAHISENCTAFTFRVKQPTKSSPWR